jgi:cell division ATPase FtsA
MIQFIPFLLATAGGYLIGSSMKNTQNFSKGGKTISEEDVKRVAKNINKEINQKQIKEVLDMYPSEQENDPEESWNLIVENLIYQVTED